LKFGQLLADKRLHVWFLIQKELACRDLDVCNKLAQKVQKKNLHPFERALPKKMKNLTFAFHRITVKKGCSTNYELV
jgi:hypothetical protein